MVSAAAKQAADHSVVSNATQFDFAAAVADGGEGCDDWVEIASLTRCLEAVNYTPTRY